MFTFIDYQMYPSLKLYIYAHMYMYVHKNLNTRAHYIYTNICR